MRLAHLILVHNNPPQLERLIQRITTINSDIFIHLDRKSKITDFDHLSSIANVFFIKNNHSIIWGDYSMVQATLDSMQEIMSTNIKYSHINLLSGQDYPLKNIHSLEDFLFQNSTKSFIRYRSINDDWIEAKNRFTLYFLTSINLSVKWRIENFINWILPRRKIPNNLEPYGYSQWLTLTPSSALYVIDYLKSNPRVKRFFKRSFAPDETLIHTILLNSFHKSDIINDNLRFIQFEEKSHHPRVLTMKDLKTLLDSDKYFGRKFSSEIDEEILNCFDNLIGERI